MNIDKTNQIIEAFAEFGKANNAAARKLTAAVNTAAGMDIGKRFMAELSAALGVPVEPLPGSVDATDWLRRHTKGGPGVIEVDESGSIINLCRVCTPRYTVDVDDMRAKPEKFIDFVDGSIGEAVKEAERWRDVYCVTGTNPPCITSVTMIDPFQITCKGEAFLVEFFMYAGLYMHLKETE
jgi:hypothetical protein